MQKMMRLSAMSIMLMFICSSCGVMFGGSKYSASINVRQHPKATITVNGQQIGTGSANVVLPRNKPLHVVVTEPGCQEQTVHFDKAFRTGNFLLSVIMWGIPGIIVDLGTGACYKPDHINDPNIVKMNDRNFNFSVDYKGCPAEATVTETSN